jgi:hypothetical protein
VSAFLRVAGSGRLADGSHLVWSVAGGRRGRRWRAMASRDGAVTHALLLEVRPDGRLSRLELTTPAGMLTLHPDEAGRVLHGNAVGADGVRHLRLAWSDEHGVEVADRPIAAAVTAHRLAGSVAVGEGRDVPVLRIGVDLGIVPARQRYDRIGEGEWRIAPLTDGAAAFAMRIDERGIPTSLEDAAEWPLELD